MEDIKVNKSDILDYSYYDENNKLVTVLNVDFLKKLFNTDIISLCEIGHR